jgi:hypothetical protein
MIVVTLDIAFVRRREPIARMFARLVIAVTRYGERWHRHSRHYRRHNRNHRNHRDNALHALPPFTSLGNPPMGCSVYK